MLDQVLTVANRDRLILDRLPVAIITCRLPDFVIDYVNPATMRELKLIEDELPCRIDELLGQSIDIFHKNPEHQRRILSDPANLPWTSRIRLGEQVLDLHVEARYDEEKQYTGAILTWSVATAMAAKEREVNRLLRMLDEMPVNIIMADAGSFDIIYANNTTRKTLSRLGGLIPCDVNDLVGQSIDIFHKRPEHQRRILADPANLPHQAKIRLGEETLDLRVAAILDEDGTYLGPMLTWDIATDRVKVADDFETNVASVVDALATASTRLKSGSESTASMAGETDRRTEAMAAATEELDASVREISEQVARAAKLGTEAVDKAERAGATIKGLQQAAEEVRTVVTTIKEIADQTNLLALNATIEAARAGDAGRGFSVVASEVKALSRNTSAATDEISQTINNIGSSVAAAASAVDEIALAIKEIESYQSGISAAVEEQGAATRDVTGNISAVSQSVSKTTEVAREVLDVTQEISSQSTVLREQVAAFIKVFRAL